MTFTNCDGSLNVFLDGVKSRNWHICATYRRAGKVQNPRRVWSGRRYRKNEPLSCRSCNYFVDCIPRTCVWKGASGVGEVCEVETKEVNIENLNHPRWNKICGCNCYCQGCGCNYGRDGDQHTYCESIASRCNGRPYQTVNAKRNNRGYFHHAGKLIKLQKLLTTSKSVYVARFLIVLYRVCE